jgi:hypothetical protein
MTGISIRPSTLRRYKGRYIQRKTVQVRKIETDAKPWFNVQKPNEEAFLMRKLLKQEVQLKALKDLEWILSEALENRI